MKLQAQTRTFLSNMKAYINVITAHFKEVLLTYSVDSLINIQ